MARKKKRLTRKQLKQQRQEAIASRRKKQGWEARPAQARPAPAKRGRSELLEDMRPLFPHLEAAPVAPGDMEQIMMPLLSSEDLIDEPEFEEIIIDPMLCIDTLAEVGQELDLAPELLDNMPEEERLDSQMKMFEMTTRRLLTDELRQEIIDALDKLRLRLKQSGKQPETARAAGIQLFLDGDKSSELWPVIGLVQAIVRRSTAIGFEVLEASAEVEIDVLDESDTTLSLSQKLARSKSSLDRKANALLKKVPGLSRFAEKQTDKVWEEGMKAIFMGDLYLELFSPEELEAGLEILLETIRGEVITEEMAVSEMPLEIPEEKIEIIVLRFDDYITELFTPERLDQLRARLNTILDESAHNKKWLTLIAMLLGYMADENAAENEKGFLIQALFGEIRVAYEKAIRS